MVLTFVLPTEQSHLHTIEELLGGGKSPVLSSHDALGPAVVTAAPPAQARCAPPSCSSLIPPWVAGRVPRDEQAEVQTQGADGPREGRGFWEMGMGLVVSQEKELVRGRGSSSLTSKLPGPGLGARRTFQR